MQEVEEHKKTNDLVELSLFMYVNSSNRFSL